MTYTDFSVVGIKIPVTSIDSRIVLAHFAAIKLFPLFRPFNAFTGNVEKGAGHCAASTFCCIHDILHTTNATDIAVFGYSLESYVSGVINGYFIRLGTFFSRN